MGGDDEEQGAADLVRPDLGRGMGAAGPGMVMLSPVEIGDRPAERYAEREGRYR